MGIYDWVFPSHSPYTDIVVFVLFIINIVQIDNNQWQTILLYINKIPLFYPLWPGIAWTGGKQFRHLFHWGAPPPRPAIQEGLRPSRLIWKTCRERVAFSVRLEICDATPLGCPVDALTTELLTAWTFVSLLPLTFYWHLLEHFQKVTWKTRGPPFAFCCSTFRKWHEKTRCPPDSGWRQWVRCSKLRLCCVFYPHFQKVFQKSERFQQVVFQNSSWQRPSSQKPINLTFGIFWVRNSAFESVTFYDHRIFNTVMTWSTCWSGSRVKIY